MKKAGDPTIHDRAAELLRRIVELPNPSRFAYRELRLTRPVSYSTTFDALVEWGYVERSSDRCGQWHYALARKGREAAAGRMKLLFAPGIDWPPRAYEPAVYGVNEGRPQRQTIHRKKK